MAHSKKEIKTIKIATTITDFFEKQGLMFDNKTREVIIKKIANLISDNFVEKKIK